MLGLIKSDFLKMKHTSYYLIHILIPILGAVMVLAYCKSSIVAAEGKVEGYFEVLSIVFPALIGIITSSVIKQEQLAGNYKEMIGSEYGRMRTLISKIIMVLTSGLMSLSLAIGLFAIGFKFILKENVLDIKFYIAEIFIIFICMIFTYIFHLLLSIEFGSGASITVGIFETLVAALMMTGLGEGVWHFVPCSWGARGSAYYMYSLINRDSLYKISSNINISIINVVAFTAIISVITFIRFKFYEGKIEN